MAVVGTLMTLVKADTSNFRSEMRNVERRAGKTRESLGGLTGGFKTLSNTIKGAGGIAAAYAIAGIGKAVLKASSDFEEANQRFSVVFRNVSKSANNVRDNLSSGYGLSRKAATDLLGATGDLLTGFEFTQQQALEFSGKVNRLAVDLASFTNIEGGAERASKSLTSALLGETEAAKALGIVLRDDDVTARLKAKGLDKLTGATLLQAKATERWNIILAQSQNAVGDFNRSSGSMANQLRILDAEYENLKANLGDLLLPTITSVVSGMGALVGETNNFFKSIKDNETPFARFINNLTTAGAMSKFVNFNQIEFPENKKEDKRDAGIMSKFMNFNQIEFPKKKKNTGLSDAELDRRWDEEMGKLHEEQSKLRLIDLDIEARKRKEIDDETLKRQEEQQAHINRLKGEYDEKFRARQLMRNDAQVIFENAKTPLEKIADEITQINELWTQGAFEGMEEGFFRRGEELKKMREKIKAEAGSFIVKMIEPKLDPEAGAFIVKMIEPKLDDFSKDNLSPTEFKQIDLKNILLGDNNVSGKKTEDKQLDEQKKTNDFLMAIAKQGIGRVARAS